MRGVYANLLIICHIYLMGTKYIYRWVCIQHQEILQKCYFLLVRFPVSLIEERKRYIGVQVNPVNYQSRILVAFISSNPAAACLRFW